MASNSDMGDGGFPNACAGVVNAPGPAVDMAWPAASNTGHDAVPGDTVDFYWSGSHNVLQVASFTGQAPPMDPYSDAGWPQELRSGDKQNNASFDWNVGTSPCGYRPGLYYFVDEDNPAGGVVSLSLTDTAASDYAAQAASALATSSVYGGRYAQYASRSDATLYEVNNFQTETHYDWAPPIFTAKQGDLVLFRWTGMHNIVQVHDVTQDELFQGGITSGAKSNCVAGPAYSCVNGDFSLGEYLFDTTNYRPGIIHISDQCAITCTGSPTGMNMEIDLRFDVPLNTPLPPMPGTCCAIDPTKGASCRVVEIYNDNDGEQLDYDVPVGPQDLVRFRFGGRLMIYQSLPNADGSPSTTAKPNGIAMPGFVDCTPGPNMSCLQGTTDQAQLVFDVAEQIQQGNVETGNFGTQFFTFYALGDNTAGYSSANTGTRLYVDTSITYNGTPCP
jgi:plastocyanin